MTLKEQMKIAGIYLENHFIRYEIEYNGWKPDYTHYHTIDDDVSITYEPNNVIEMGIMNFDKEYMKIVQLGDITEDSINETICIKERCINSFEIYKNIEEFITNHTCFIRPKVVYLGK